MSQLIFDVGMHQGEDTGFYLAKGFTVVAIDADPRLIARATDQFSDAIRDGRLTLIGCAVGAEEGQSTFHLSEETLWNSMREDVASREQRNTETVTVRTRRLSDLLLEYGVPHYCKIDVEGMDATCLRTLEGAAQLPQFISVESECGGDERPLSEAEALETFELLCRLGYRQFKLVDQMSLLPLTPTNNIYRDRPSFIERARKRLGGQGYDYYNFWDVVERHRPLLSKAQSYVFPKGASGPFGDEIASGWLDPATARETLLRHRREYFRTAGARNYGFWCDWHARRG